VRAASPESGHRQGFGTIFVLMANAAPIPESQLTFVAFGGEKQVES
jgi:hypothetical protein